MDAVERELELAGKTRDELVELLTKTWPGQDRAGIRHTTFDYDALGLAIRQLTPPDQIITLGGDPDEA